MVVLRRSNAENAERNFRNGTQSLSTMGSAKGDRRWTTEIDRERPDLGNSQVETHPQETVADPTDYDCEVCQERFPTKIGFGQHIRHRHPDLSNQKRIAAVETDIERKRRVQKAEAAAKASGTSSRLMTNPKMVTYGP